jgi:hypothetical protein
MVATSAGESRTFHICTAKRGAFERQGRSAGILAKRTLCVKKSVTEGKMETGVALQDRA